MNRSEYRLIDKSGWPDGPWQGEPDRIQWPDERTGMPCLITRHPRRGHLCGYVAVPPGHPLHGGDAESIHVATHWEITYAGPPGEGSIHETVTHEPGPGEPADMWWFGFHCCHAGDMCPNDPVTFHEGYEYRDAEYVGMVCAIVAAQFATVQARHDEIVRNAAFVCPQCGTPSGSQEDAANGYCGKCHDFTGTETTRCP